MWKFKIFLVKAKKIINRWQRKLQKCSDQNRQNKFKD